MDIFQTITNEGKAFLIGSSPYHEGEKAHTFFAFVASSFHELHTGHVVGRSYYNDHTQMSESVLQAYHEHKHILSRGF